MSDYRNSELRRPRNDPLRRDPAFDRDARHYECDVGMELPRRAVHCRGVGGLPLASATSLANRAPTRRPNDVTPPAATRMAPPLTMAPAGQSCAARGYAGAGHADPELAGLAR